MASYEGFKLQASHGSIGTPALIVVIIATTKGYISWTTMAFIDPWFI